MVIQIDCKMFEVNCSSCEWEDTVTVRGKLGELSLIETLPIFGKIAKKYTENQLPSECPKCGAKVTAIELPVRF